MVASSLCEHRGMASSAFHICMSAAQIATATSERICASRFRSGDFWVWLYSDGSGQPSSWERYTVGRHSTHACASALTAAPFTPVPQCSSQQHAPHAPLIAKLHCSATQVRASEGASVVLDMASKFAEDDPYATHHSMRLSLTDNLMARDTHEQWTFKEFAFRSGGQWLEAPHRDNVQAFEEKFDAFLMSPALPAPARILRGREKEVAAVGRASLIQSRRHQYTNAWYIREPRRHAGVAGFKAFGVEGRSETFTFELIATGSATDTSAGGPLDTGASGRSPYG